jgi:hypothetical protein
MKEYMFDVGGGGHTGWIELTLDSSLMEYIIAFSLSFLSWSLNLNWYKKIL